MVTLHFFALSPKPIARFRWKRARLSLFRPQPHLPSFVQIHPSLRDLLAKTTFQIVTVIGDPIGTGSPINMFTCILHGFAAGVKKIPHRSFCSFQVSRLHVGHYSCGRLMIAVCCSTLIWCICVRLDSLFWKNYTQKLRPMTVSGRRLDENLKLLVHSCCQFVCYSNFLCWCTVRRISLFSVVYLMFSCAAEVRRCILLIWASTTFCVNQRRSKVYNTPQNQAK